MIKKLRIQPGHRALVLNPPEGYVEALGDLPESVEFNHEPGGRFDFVHLFLRDSEDYGRLGPAALQAVKQDGLFWISYPKKSADVESDLSREAWALLARSPSPSGTWNGRWSCTETDWGLSSSFRFPV